jgi:hypothetical protein
VSVKNPEIGCFFPLKAVLRFGNVEDDGHSVLIIVANRSLVGRCRVGLNEPIGFQRVLRLLLLEIGNGG